MRTLWQCPISGVHKNYCDCNLCVARTYQEDRERIEKNQIKPKKA